MTQHHSCTCRERCVKMSESIDGVRKSAQNTNSLQSGMNRVRGKHGHDKLLGMQ